MEKVKYTRNEYREEYLKSDEWKKLRNLIMSTSPNCQCCGGASSDVHHIIYRNIVDITINDLIPVCRNCHEYIHQAIDDDYISQDPKDFKTIKEKTLNILNDKTYKEYRKWLNDKHNLSVEEIKDINNLQSFVIKKIAGIKKAKIWYDNLSNIKFTGRQILQIRNIIKLAKYRRNKKIDKLPRGIVMINKEVKNSMSLKNLKGFKSRKGLLDIN